MLIISQDKNFMINFNNFVYIDIEKNSFDKYVVEAYYNSKDEDYVWLGEYSTIEKAREILEEIIEEYKEEGICGVGDCFANNNRIFRMPRE